MNNNFHMHAGRALFGTITALLLVFSGISNAIAQPTQCDSQACFADQFEQCQPATFNTPAAMGAKGRYTIQGAQADGCRVAFVFTQNPNPDWVNKPVSFLLDTAAPLDGQLKAAVAACLMDAGSEGDFACQNVDAAAADSSSGADNGTQADITASLAGSVTLNMRGDEQTFGWNEAALVMQAPPGFYIVTMGGMGYKVEANNGQLAVTDTNVFQTPDAGNVDLAFEDTGKTETIAGITGHVFKATGATSGKAAKTHALTLTDDPRVVAINANLASMFPVIGQISQTLPDAYPGLLAIPGKDGAKIPEYISFSAEQPDFFEPVLQAAKAYAAAHPQ